MCVRQRKYCDLELVPWPTPSLTDVDIKLFPEFLPASDGYVFEWHLLNDLLARRRVKTAKKKKKSYLERVGKLQ